jgi:hypothetical protein
MGNSIWTSSPSNSSTASFRDWGSKISSGLAASGLIKLPISGQIIDWSTQNPPSSPNSVSGVEWWGFNDEFQDEEPIGFLISYGSGNSISDPSISLNIAYRVDNEFNSITTKSIAFTFSGISDPGIRTSFASGDGSGLTLALFSDSTQIASRQLLVIDRFRNIDGSVRGGGYIMIFKPAQSDTGSFYVFRPVNGTNMYTVSKSPPALIPMNINNTTSLSDGVNKYVSPYMVANPQGDGVIYVKMIVCCASFDFSFSTLHDLSHLGALRSYRALGSLHGYMDSKEQSNASGLVWWDDMTE